MVLSTMKIPAVSAVGDSMSVLLLDSRDSFTWNLAHAFREVGARVQVEPSEDRAPAEVLARMRAQDLSLLCVGPGPRAPESVPGLVPLLRELTGEVPILGVCLGLQALVLAHGGALGRAKAPVHGKVTDVHHDGEGLFRGLPDPARCMRYHSLIATDVPARFTVSARCSDGQPMAIRDEAAGARAVQFHPESIGTEGGLVLLANALLAAGSPARVPPPRPGGVPPPAPRAAQENPHASS
jgi:anthranilate synthase/aminodeoxychorismate synthase-like glutamine amidotransferase